MNLSWLSAVFTPRDVAPHVNFRRDSYDNRGAPVLAALLLGQPERLTRGLHEDWPTSLRQIDPALPHVVDCFDATKIIEGYNSLRYLLIDESTIDPARSTALSIIAACASAEMDDFDSCDLILQEALARLTSGSPEERLMRGSLIVQQALRARDRNLDPSSLCAEAIRLFRGIDAQRLSPYEVSPGVSWNSAVTNTAVLEMLTASAMSLMPSQLFGGEETSPDLPSRLEQVRLPQPRILADIMVRQNVVFGDDLTRRFEEGFHSQTRQLFGRQDPDFFFVCHALERTGHAAVYLVRREMGLYRLLDAARGTVETISDGLRALRQSGALKELRLALNGLRDGGPIASLSQDARQILANRARAGLLGPCEIEVLDAAAELLTPSEAAKALRILQETLERGGPKDAPGTWQSSSTRVEPVLRAVCAMANGAEQVAEVAALLLQQVASLANVDELLDRAYARALDQLEWSTVPSSVKEGWRKWRASSSPAVLKAVKEVLDGALASDEAATDDDPVYGEGAESLTDVANALADAVRHGNDRLPIESRIDQSAINLVVADLDHTRSEAARGAFGFGGVDTGDLAASLISFAGANQLWGPLTSLLLDPSVHEEHKSFALDRLASHKPPMPASAWERLTAGAESLVFDPRAHPSLGASREIRPYPAGLRFAAVYNLLPANQWLAAVANLASSQTVAERAQGARTVATIIRHVAQPDLFSLALVLSFDSDIRVTAHASRALASMAAGSDHRTVIEQRLIELLAHDGLLVPVVAIRSLDRDIVRSSASIRDALRHLSRRHPSRAVRREAEKFSDVSG